MAQTYTIEGADGTEPLDPQALRELRDLLRDDEDLDLGVTLKDRPPAPGEQGAIPVAVEVVAASAPIAGALAKVLGQWIASRRVVLKVTAHGHKVRTIELSANAAEAERLLRSLMEDKGA
jgi:hypothetical protein